MFKLQVKCGVLNSNKREWKFMKPHNGDEYEYPTEKEAEDMLAICVNNPASKPNYRVKEV